MKYILTPEFADFEGSDPATLLAPASGKRIILKSTKLIFSAERFAYLNTKNVHFQIVLNNIVYERIYSDIWGYRSYYTSWQYHADGIDGWYEATFDYEPKITDPDDRGIALNSSTSDCIKLALADGPPSAGGFTKLKFAYIQETET